MKFLSSVLLQRVFSIVICAASLASCGGGGGAPAPASVSTVPSISLVAGDIGGPGNLDGIAEAARFNGPAGVAVDAAGNAYVVDANNRSVRRVSAGGEVSLLAGIDTPGDISFMHPQRDGDRTVASFNRPVGVALDAARGVLYVTDYDRIRRVSLDGTISTLSPFPLFSFFSIYPSAVAVAPDGTAVMAAGKLATGFRSCCRSTAIYRFPETGGPTLLAGNPDLAGGADGQGAAARFENIGAIAIDRSGTIYVADGATLRTLTPDGVVSTLAGSATPGFVDGAGTQARLGRSLGLGIDADGNVLVADPDSRSIRKVTPKGVVSTLFGEVPFVAGRTPSIVVDASGRILYTTPNGLFSAQPGNAARLIAGTLLPAPATLLAPGGALARDSRGNLFRAAPDGSIRKFAPDGTTVLAFGPGSGDLVVQPAPGSLYRNVLAIDAADNLYQSYLTFEGGTPAGGSVLRISPSGQTTLLASSNSSSAVPFKPVRITHDTAGNLYFVDEFGPAVRKLGPTGTLTTVADLSSAREVTSGVGRFGLAVDRNGNVFMNSDSRCVVYRISAAGLPVVFAGQLDQCGQADGAPAQARLEFPGPPVIDSAGNLYVTNPSTIRRIAPDGTVTTVAGQAGRTGTRLGPLPGTLGALSSLLIGSDDSLYVVADQSLLKINTR